MNQQVQLCVPLRTTPHPWINAFAFPNPSAPHYTFLPPEASTSYVAVKHAKC